MVFEVMLKDRVVVSIDIKTGKCTANDLKFVPPSLQLNYSAETFPELYRNLQQFDAWCASRILSLDRKYAKQIYNAIGLSQLASMDSKAQFARTLSCVSLQDCFWCRKSDSEKTWKEVNLFNNSLSQALTIVSLRGRGVTIQGRNLADRIHHSPDIHTNGTYAKAWQRIENDIVLYKPNDTNVSNEVQREVLASNILDCFNVPHVKYWHTIFEGSDVSACKCIASEKFAIIPFSDIRIQCIAENRDPISFIKSIDSDGFYKMLIATYLIGNTDLHDGNWGLYFDNDLGEYTRVFDLFDFNNAFTDYKDISGGMCLPLVKCIDIETGNEILNLDNIEDYNFEYRSECDMLTAAKQAMEHCTFRQIKPIQFQIFYSEELYGLFRQRCELIGLHLTEDNADTGVVGLDYF